MIPLSCLFCQDWLSYSGSRFHMNFRIGFSISAKSSLRFSQEKQTEIALGSTDIYCLRICDNGMCFHLFLPSLISSSNILYFQLYQFFKFAIVLGIEPRAFHKLKAPALPLGHWAVSPALTFYFETRALLCCQHWPQLLGSSKSLASASPVAGTSDLCYHVQFFFILFDGLINKMVFVIPFLRV